tara:strand:+ start:913 stop:1491 length:579 start_codon:yes stop_codon:yes gene_type:complete
MGNTLVPQKDNKLTKIRIMKRIILVGKAGSGKDFFRDYMHKRGRLVDVSFTTRPPRTGEVDGYTYNYVSDNAFENMKLGEQLFECVSFNGWHYGTSMQSWENSELFIMTPSGVGQIPKEDLKDCIVVFFDIAQDVRRERLSKRSDADSVERRIAADDKDFKGFDLYNIKVTNPMYQPDYLQTLIASYEVYEV